MAKRRDEPKFTLINENTMQKPVELIQPLKIQLDFDSWWLITQNRLKLKPELKESVKKHFLARGFMAQNDFDAGLIDFGIKS